MSRAAACEQRRQVFDSAGRIGDVCRLALLVAATQHCLQRGPAPLRGDRAFEAIRGDCRHCRHSRQPKFAVRGDRTRGRPVQPRRVARGGPEEEQAHGAQEATAKRASHVDGRRIERTRVLPSQPVYARAFPSTREGGERAKGQELFPSNSERHSLPKQKTTHHTPPYSSGLAVPSARTNWMAPPQSVSCSLRLRPSGARNPAVSSFRGPRTNGARLSVSTSADAALPPTKLPASSSSARFAGGER
eukprot:scaffold20662_cov66-Phaeocystis_antarctica.AAC.11